MADSGDGAPSSLALLGRATKRLSDLLGTEVRAATKRDESLVEVAIALPSLGRGVITAALTREEAQLNAAGFVDGIADAVAARLGRAGKSSVQEAAPFFTRESKPAAPASRVVRIGRGVE